MALPQAIALFIASQGAKKTAQTAGSQVAKNWTKQNVSKGTGSALNKKGSSQLRDRIAINNAKTGLGMAGLVGIPAFGMVGMELYQTIKSLLDEGKLREDFDEAELEQALMEADYDAEALDEVKGELYEGPDEDEKFLSSYIRGGQTGLRNEQGDLMTRQESKDEYARLHGSK
jgi:hypothetical protein